ncbi:MAG: hypothetical protein AAB074_17250 [Planctomycetota bacterium]
MVVAAAQVDRNVIGRFRLKRNPDASFEGRSLFVKDAIESGSRVIVDDSKRLSRVHRAASLLKRRLLGRAEAGSSPTICPDTWTSSPSA